MMDLTKIKNAIQEGINILEENGINNPLELPNKLIEEVNKKRKIDEETIIGLRVSFLGLTLMMFVREQMTNSFELLFDPSKESYLKMKQIEKLVCKVDEITNVYVDYVKKLENNDIDALMKEAEDIMKRGSGE